MLIAAKVPIVRTGTSLDRLNPLELNDELVGGELRSG
jgi:hypothetical protein